MKRNFSCWKTAGMIALAALPMTTSGCRSMGSSSWGMPSFSSWNPWKKSSTDLAQAKPSNQVPTPPAAMMAGAGNARPAMSAPGMTAPGMTAPAGYPTAPTGAAPAGYASAPAGYGRPAGYPTATNPNGYAAQQTSAVQPAAGYNTGSPYAMGAPAGSAAPAGYGQPNYATADQRSAAGYGAAASTPSYGAYSQPSNPGATNTNPYGAGAAPAGYSAPAAAPPASPYGNPSTPAWNTGSKNSWSAPGTTENNQLRGLASSASGTAAMPPAPAAAEPNSLSAPTVARSEGAYRPGSTGRSTSAPEGGDVQPAAYNSATANSAPSSNYQGAYPNTGAAAPTNDAPLYR